MRPRHLEPHASPFLWYKCQIKMMALPLNARSAEQA